jgi:hypothetical protein
MQLWDTSIGSAAKVRLPCILKSISSAVIQKCFSVKKGLTRPPSAIPSTIIDDGVQPGQVEAFNLPQSTELCTSADAWRH